MSKLFKSILFVAICFIFSAAVGSAMAGPPKNPARSKFYDFSEQLIDGEIKKPTALYTDSRQRVKFERLLRLKKSFMRDLFSTARERVFK